MTLRACAYTLRNNDKILILTHRRPDGDTIGSAAGLCRALRKIGKTAYLYANSGFTAKYAPYAAPFIAPDDFVPAFLVAVDLADTGLFPKGFDGNVDLCIDHHGSNTYYARETYVDSGSASCGEIILEIIKELGCALDKEMAEDLYVAISTDTGCFEYSNTNAHTLRAAAELIDAGVENGRLNKMLFRTVSKARIALEAMIYDNIKYYADGKIVIATVTDEMNDKAGITRNDCDDLANLAGRIEGGIASVTIKERETGCRVSIRTTDEVDASAVCAKFGGGGHKRAAGCSLDCPCTEAADIIAKAIEEEMK